MGEELKSLRIGLFGSDLAGDSVGEGDVEPGAPARMSGCDSMSRASHRHLFSRVVWHSHLSTEGRSSLGRHD